MKNTNQSLFGKYEMIKDLGTGSSGSVTLVRHISMDQERALKKVPKASAFAESGVHGAAESDYRLRRDLSGRRFSGTVLQPYDGGGFAKNTERYS